MAAAAAARREVLSPVRIHVPLHRGSSSAAEELSGDDDPVTTPEASTDSENDSSFESDTDDDGRSMPSSIIRRKAPSW